jgi:macrolide transport system ATP-binding/permease protein
MPTILLDSVAKRFAGKRANSALEDVSLTVEQGEFVAIVGPSGGGKSTLLNIIGLLDRPSSGAYLLDGSDAQRRAHTHRSDHFAFIFQNFYLLDHRPAVDSVELALAYRGVSRRLRRERSLTALTAVGLADKADQLPSTFSGGERQRVAIARALATQAPIVIADEPTGNLDEANAEQIMASLAQLHERGATVIVVTHSEAVAARAQRRLRISSGRLSEDTQAATSEPVRRSQSLPQPPPGRASRQRFSDIMSDAWLNLVSRSGRLLSLTAAVAIAVALLVVTSGLAVTARAQVSAGFTASENREVTLRWSQTQTAPPGDTDAAVSARLAKIVGVDAAAVVRGYDDHHVRYTPTGQTISAGLYSVAGDFVRAGRMSIDWSSRHRNGLAPREVLIGGDLATQLELGPLTGAPSVMVDGLPYPVAGVITGSSRVPDLMGAVVRSSVGAPSDATRSDALVLTRPGAAHKVSQQAPLAVDPYDPQSIQIEAPLDNRNLRESIESSVSIALLALSGVALVAAIASLANSMLLAVMQRKQEIGLRRALGARRLQVIRMIAVESALVGALGGVGGLLAGMLGVLGVTIGRNWIPTFDPSIAPLAVLGGILIGVLGGAAAAVRAARIHPADALRL